MQYFFDNTPLPLFIPYARFLLDFPLNETARLVYTLLLSRVRMSQSNGWTDADRRVYCRYTIKELMEDTGKSKSTIVAALADLEEQGLLTRRRAGAGYANQLYLRFPENRTSDDRKTPPQSTGKPNPNKYTNKYTNKNTKIFDYDYTGGSL